MGKQKLPGWDQELMVSSFTKEATYGAGVTVNSSNFAAVKGFELTREHGDTVSSDEEHVHGSELATTQEIIEQRFKASLGIPRARPHDLATLIGLAGGAVTSTQDGAFNAWRHKVVPVAADVELPSAHLIQRLGTVQQGHKGIKADSVKVTFTPGEMLKVDSELIGDGSRADDANSFEAAISEVFLKCNEMKVFAELGT